MSTLARVSDVDVQDATETDSVGGVRPRLVARPTSTEQVSQLLSAAAEDGLVVVPRGHGTKLRWGVPPRSVDVLLDLSGMDRVLEHQAGDLIVAAEAGTPLAAMQDTCARADQRLAIDELVPGTTIGGLIATNLSGPRRMAYGTMRDLLIGVTVVRPDGVVAKAGGKVVKNVAGYDLGKLMTGSFGTLAVVTSAFFRLHPVPETSTWVSVEAESPSAATETVRQAVHSQMVPAAVEIDAQPGRPTLVSALLEGTEVGVAGRVDQLLRLWGDTAAVDTQERPRGFPRESESQALLKLTCAISAVPEIAQAAVAFALEHYPQLPVVARIAAGNEPSLRTVRRSGMVGLGPFRMPHDPPGMPDNLLFQSPAVRLGLDDTYEEVLDLWQRVNAAGGAVGFEGATSTPWRCDPSPSSWGI